MFPAMRLTFTWLQIKTVDRARSIFGSSSLSAGERVAEEEAVAERLAEGILFPPLLAISLLRRVQQTHPRDRELSMPSIL